jgi:hypothetical protein
MRSELEFDQSWGDFAPILPAIPSLATIESNIYAYSLNSEYS